MVNGLLSGAPSLCSFHTRPTTHLYFNFRLKPSISNTNMTLPLSNTNNNSSQRKLPILLFDIMDTIVRDPFYHDVPAFFGYANLFINHSPRVLFHCFSPLFFLVIYLVTFRMSLKELIDCKHPTAWIEFEKGLIDEVK